MRPHLSQLGPNPHSALGPGLEEKTRTLRRHSSQLPPEHPYTHTDHTQALEYLCSFSASSLSPGRHLSPTFTPHRALDSTCLSPHRSTRAPTSRIRNKAETQGHSYTLSFPPHPLPPVIFQSTHCRESSSTTSPPTSIDGPTYTQSHHAGGKEY